MRPSRAAGFGLPPVARLFGAWLFATLLFAAGLFGGGTFGGGTFGIPEARAQGSLTAPAGQSRVTAPGGLRGRAARRAGTHRRR